MESNEIRVSAEEARVAVATGGATALDIQAEEEWHESRVPGAVHCEETDLEAGLEGLSRESRIIVICEDGARSAAIAKGLRDVGWQAACVEGGMKAWRDEDFPVQPSEDADDDAKI
jgi:rhodanese-related sulfurtransferase